MTEDYVYAPGTVHLVDVDNVLDVKKQEGKNSNVILNPQPSSNPNDPLRWSQRKKYFQFGLLWFWGFMLAVSANFGGPAYEPWIEDLHTDYNQLNIAGALLFLFLGLGCLFLQPTAMKVGRRFVYLLCTVIVMLAMVVGGVGKNVSYIQGSYIMIGFAAAPVDSLVEISSTDVFFQHERSTAFALMILALYAGSNLGPVAAGFVVQAMSWQWLFWIQLFIYAGLIIIQFFFMFDTTFNRDHDEEDRLEAEIISIVKSHESMVLTHGKETRQKSPEYIDEVVSGCSDSIDQTIEKRTYKDSLKLIETEYSDPRSWFVIFFRPFLLVSFPAIVWSGLTYGAQIMWLQLMAVTQSLVFSAEPYNFSPNGVGLTNLAPFVGCCIGMLYGGNYVDWLSVRLARKNNGIFEPEMRLHAMWLPLLTNAGGLLAYGLGCNAGVHWAIPVVLGYGCLGFAMSSSGAICLTYAVDSYHKVGSEALVIILLFRNLIGMAFCFAIDPWLQGCGLVLTTWLMFMLSLVINGSYIIMLLWGKKFRIWTTDRYQRISEPGFGEFWKK
ncbi:hypothetical protein DIURU_003303 [Diutina rugosa]|uniref:Major facilitator superfamily (MFS) profile domain-containing protein n=1 Tax=Diutina rugosa TaxID=5481 RepID=A0A642UKU5_DIURU|nr:uncharacterized protein DIURU_003303 [Diutina rugosa]KAA8900933.1 hypothetical protein DIURU_003303 [Diutina rugosa]